MESEAGLITVMTQDLFIPTSSKNYLREVGIRLQSINIQKGKVTTDAGIWRGIHGIGQVPKSLPRTVRKEGKRSMPFAVVLGMPMRIVAKPRSEVKDAEHREPTTRLVFDLSLRRKRMLVNRVSTHNLSTRWLSVKRKLKKKG